MAEETDFKRCEPVECPEPEDIEWRTWSFPAQMPLQLIPKSNDDLEDVSYHVTRLLALCDPGSFPGGILIIPRLDPE